MGIENKINDLYSTMNYSSPVEKGALGEKQVFSICEEFYQEQGGILLHSYSYRVSPELQGNIKKNQNGIHYIESLGDHTELDVLYISKYRIFPIEVKTYSAKKIVLTDDGMSGAAHNDKSPVHQNEMHCRHLYDFLYRGIPSGGVLRPIQYEQPGFATEYIVPIVCFTDKCTISDERSDWQYDYIKVTNLNGLASLIKEYNTPLDERINLRTCENVLRENGTAEKWLSYRDV